MSHHVEKDTPSCLACAWEAALLLPRDTYKDHTCGHPLPPAGDGAA